MPEIVEAFHRASRKSKAVNPFAEYMDGKIRRFVKGKGKDYTSKTVSFTQSAYEWAKKSGYKASVATGKTDDGTEFTEVQFTPREPKQ